jgi:hypothetical protein
MNNKVVELLKTSSNTLSDLRAIYKDSSDDEIRISLSSVIEKLINLQSLAIDVQLSYQNIVDENDTARKEIMKYKQWTENAPDYKSFRLFSGATVMVTKEPDTSPYIKEWYCKPCFDKQKKSQLQAMPAEHRNLHMQS